MKKFKKIYIEITNVCNLSCDFCPKNKRKPEYMNVETFQKILQQIKPYTDYIYFHVMGEPLLHPLIGSFLDLSYNLGFKVNLTTNGTLIKSEGDKIINKPALRLVNFSLHSFNANTLKNSIANYLDDIFTFTKKAQQCSPVIICLRLWNLKEHRENTKVNEYVLGKIQDAFSLNYKIDEELTLGNGIKVSPKLYISQASRFYWPIDKSCEENNTGFCYGLRDQAAVLVDGTVVPCCLDSEGIINLGNINIANFSDIISSTRASQLYNGFSNRKVIESLCKTCDYRRRFNTK